MCPAVENPARCEIRGVIRFFFCRRKAKGMVLNADRAHETKCNHHIRGALPNSEKLRRSVQNKRGCLTSGVALLLHNNARNLLHAETPPASEVLLLTNENLC